MKTAVAGFRLGSLWATEEYNLADCLERYRQHKSRAKSKGIEFTLTFKEWWEAWEPYWKARGPRGWVMIQSVPGDGFTRDNIEIVPKAESFRRAMDNYYGGITSHLP